MKKINVSEATNTQLDWLVARALGKNPSLFIFKQAGQLAPEHNYTTNPSQMGPIIEREGISISCYKNCPYLQMRWSARLGTATDPAHMVSGPTALIAAARCFIVSKLGETVEVPEELM